VERLIDVSATARSADVVHRGGDTFVAFDAAEALLDEARRQGVKVLGLEGFLVAEDAVYPALGRIADFSAEPASTADARARALLRGPWAHPPTAEDQVHRDAAGGHMLTIVLDDGHTLGPSPSGGGDAGAK
jgi:hypothetical protein